MCQPASVRGFTSPSVYASPNVTRERLEEVLGLEELQLRGQLAVERAIEIGRQRAVRVPLHRRVDERRAGGEAPEVRLRLAREIGDGDDPVGEADALGVRGVDQIA